MMSPRCPHRHRPRRAVRLAGPVRLLVLLGLAALLAGGASPAPADAATITGTSTNWAGYVVRRTGVTFRDVSASWVVPVVDCRSGRSTSSANWVGIGGYASMSPALEQVGTESDCSASGQPKYSSWFEIVPAVASSAHLTVHPGDTVSARVTVHGKRVRLRLSNTTRGTSSSKTVNASAVDLTSAEWIVEAPSICVGTSAAAARCMQTELSNFGTTSFSSASATSTTGHTGTVADSAWTTIALTLRGAGAGGRGGHGPWGGFARASAAGATPAAPSADGSVFSVGFTNPEQPSTTTPAPTSTATPAPASMATPAGT
jgi:hypothetical protein